MPPKSTASMARGRPGAGKKRAPVIEEPASSNPFESSSDEQARRDEDDDRISDEIAEVDGEPEKTIPRDLVTRLLHDFFTTDSIRISRDANAAVGKYVEIFLREAIARAALESKGGFFDVEDLEKIAPQLLMDL